ncbi:MAG TPA: translocation/assembly module TamB domain-containing protein [Candidatus Acidoferrum sp.]|nr:translocation/assembly module TamB domain-containing protein [Candidatus Acidoferrum sp.]
MKSRQIIRWTLAGLVALIVIAGIGGYLFLKSRAFQHYALRKIAQTVEESTGGKTEIRALDFSFSTLTAHLYNITVHGTEPPAQPPLLQIAKLTVGFKIQSVLHRKVNPLELIVERPVVNVRVDHAGHSNLPVTPPRQSSSHFSVFDLAVRHVALVQGEVSYNDKKTPLDADLYNLDADIHFDPAAVRYFGSISYDDGHLRYGQYAPLPHSFQAEFGATPAELLIHSAVMRVGNSVVSVRAAVSNYADPALVADYNIRIDTRDLASMAPAYRPSGEFSLIGQIRYKNLPQRSMLRNLSVDGQLASETLSAAAPSGRIAVSKLKGRYQLTNGNLEANGIEFDSLGGRVGANLSVHDLDTTPSGNLQTSLHGLSLRSAQQILRPQLRQVAVSGVLNGTAHASWSGSISNIRVRSDLLVSAAAKNTARSTADEIPVDGVIHANYDGSRNALTLRESSLRIPSATLTADGELGRRSNLQVQVQASDLHQLESVAAVFRDNDTALPSVSGSATVNAAVRGPLMKPQIVAEISAQNLSVQGSQWSSAKANLAASPSQVAVTNGSLVSAQRGRASFSATVSLKDWSYLPANLVKANLSLQRFPIAALERLANLQYPVSGDLDANISVSGSQLDPQGSGKLQIVNARAYGETFQTLAAQFHTDHGSIISQLHVGLPAGSANADLSYTAKTKAYTVRLNAPGLVLQKLHTVQAKNLGLSGTVTAAVSGQGTIDDPQLSAVLQLPQLSIRDKSISNVNAELHIANHKADLALNSKVIDSSVQARASVNLTGDYYADASLQTTAIPLDVLLATYLSSVPQGFQGQTEFHATLKGPLKDKTQLEAHLTVPTLNATYQSLEITAASPIQADYAHSVLTLQPTEIRGTGTSLRLQGEIPFAGHSAPSFTAQGSLDARILQIVSPDAKSSGTALFDIRATGTAQDPSISGQIRLQDIAVLYAGSPVALDKLNGTLELGRQSVQISHLTGQLNGGDISAGGSIAYRPTLEFNVALQGKSIRLRYPDGTRISLDGNLAFAGNQESSTLSGRVLIDSLSFTPDFDLASFADQFSANTATPAQPGVADRINLAIGVQSKENLSAQSSQLSLEGSVNLRVGGTAANPVITGRTDLTSGELFYRNVRYELQRGILSFDDPNQTNPVLNVSVTTTVEQYNLTLNLRGPFDKLTTSYMSDPPLPTADIINLIARGKTTQESASSSQSTDSMIASGAASELTGSVQKLAGISSLQIDPLIGGNNQNPSARIAVQQRVTKNFLFTFSTDVSQPGSEVVQGDYQINKRWSVSVTRDEVGGVAVDGRLHTRF